MLRAIAAGTLLAIVSSGCAFLGGPEVSYVSNREILARVASGARLSIDASLFEPARAEILDDAVLLHYRGVRYAGDQLWVWRFSPKSSEQEPESLADVSTFIPLIEQGRRDFAAEPAQRSEFDGAVLHWVRYTFESPVRDAQGKAQHARGILGIVETTVEKEPVIYYFNLDNWGDRSTLDLEDIEFLVRTMLG